VYGCRVAVLRSIPSSNDCNQYCDEVVEEVSTRYLLVFFFPLKKLAWQQFNKKTPRLKSILAFFLYIIYTWNI
jgi:hypothetical protein